ncbi:MAG TPA: ferrous iron transport protein B [Ferruginibacter sp.]|nr:ferrous iron transport protein B [Chitinophagales bacterium]HMX79587.1 ferrous iron transport protein B [Ferruginibacter sp.]HNF00941.1 ferrous iron transport protein B [Ferruginibacter sp.]HNL64267.1 ferrous iron transport protein B [Ferruginibacter sp.]HNN69668.1 ferrous iron transport protein B [Ferruginibacter sp.]
MAKHINIALVGNPNSGKSSLFNYLTGLKQQVGNFPGVTVDKKTGSSQVAPDLNTTLIDLPGTYSLYPKRHDEWVAYKVLLNQDTDIKPDMVLLVADASNLKRNLLFCSQIIDLGVPVVVALTMMDLAKKKGTQIDIPGLERELGVPVVPINPRKNKGIDQLKKVIAQSAENLYQPPARDFIDNNALAENAIASVKQHFPGISNYKAIHYLINHEHFLLHDTMQDTIEQIEIDNAFNPTKTQADEIMQRYTRIKHIMQQTVVEADPLQKALFTERLDDLLLHRRWGYIILLAVLFLLFQSVFWIAQYPMDGIEWTFGQLSGWLGNTLPQTGWSDLLINGVVAGLSGIVVFIPQIMILFGLITILEDTGYMARISFLTDKLMRKVGLNGKSVMPMISGFACAVPAIMSARNIENRKERLLTIMITPLMSCSARLPVYTILIALVIPSKLYFGFLSLQGLVMMALYLLGTVMALLVSWVMKWFIKSTERSFFILELPTYRAPRWRNALTTMIEKAKIFVFDAGKVIMVISLLLWALSTYGPKKKMDAVTAKYEQLIRENPGQVIELEKHRKTELLQSSYAGTLGKAIEPAISPLGYDWKIGIALITSFAAREVFVGTMATLYSVGDDADENSTTLREKMASATRSDGTKVYNLATGLSLLIFYVLAMQCMSTLAVVKRETRSWKWPAIQLLYMTALAYLMSWMTYTVFS